jgi:hypothetical protein
MQTAFQSGIRGSYVYVNICSQVTAFFSPRNEALLPNIAPDTRTFSLSFLESTVRLCQVAMVRDVLVKSGGFRLRIWLEVKILFRIQMKEMRE